MMTVTWWRRFRNIDRVEVLTQELQISARDNAELTRINEKLRDTLDRAHERLTMIKTVAEEGAKNVDKLEREIERLREQNDRIVSERLKSLDAMNVRLMEPRVEPPPPDIQQFSRPSQQLDGGIQAVEKMRKINRMMDIELLGKLHPSFGNLARRGVPTNEPINPTNLTNSSSDSDSLITVDPVDISS